MAVESLCNSTAEKVDSKLASRENLRRLSKLLVLVEAHVLQRTDARNDIQNESLKKLHTEKFGTVRNVKMPPCFCIVLFTTVMYLLQCK